MTYEGSHPYNSGHFYYLPRNAVSPARVATDQDNRTIIVLEPGTPQFHTNENYGNPDFIAEISKCQPLKLEPVFSSWDYHQKNLAQEVLPFIFLGPMGAARDPKFIQVNGITMLLAVRDGRAAALSPKIMDPARFFLARNIATATFDMLDELDMLRRFRGVIKQMNDHLLSQTSSRPINQLSDVGGKILVFCEAGDKRSAALVVLYCMVMFGLSGKSAVQAVQARRYGVHIAADLYRMIQAGEDLLKAERQVSACRQISRTGSNAHEDQSRKRSFNDTQQQDEDVDWVMGDDPRSREGSAPFRDVGD